MLIAIIATGNNNILLLFIILCGTKSSNTLIIIDTIFNGYLLMKYIFKQHARCIKYTKLVS